MRFLILMFGVFTCSTSIIFLKESSWPPIMLSAARLLAAALLLFPLYITIYKRQQQVNHKQLLKNSLIPAIMLSIHFMSWILGLRMTSVANATLIVNIVPLCMPFVLFFLLREKPNRHEIICTGIAILGLAIIAAGDFHLSIESFYGDLICFASMTTFAVYLALSRLYKQASSIWLYVTPVYAIAGSICLCISYFVDDCPNISYALNEWLYIAALAIIPTIFGHSILNAAMRWFRGQVVSVINMTQFVFAGIMGWYLYAEIPHMSFFMACTLIVGAAISLVYFHRAEEPVE